MGSAKPNLLMRYLPVARRHCEITSDGKVCVPEQDQNRLEYRAKDRILLYLIGKLYACLSRAASSEQVANQEVLDELNIAYGSLRPRLLELRRKGRISEKKDGKTAFHFVTSQQATSALDKIDARYAGRKIPGRVFKRTGTAETARRMVLDEPLPITRKTSVEVVVTIPDEQAPEKT